MTFPTIKFETTGNVRSGTAQKTGKPYFMAEAYAHLPGVPYPQKFSYYAASNAEVLQPGMYEADVIVGIKDDRLDFQVDPRQSRRINTQPAAAKVG